jgi:hypothetical protein
MRLYNRTDFLKLPPGTIFCAGMPFAFAGIRVKADTLPYNDFVALDLQWIEAHDSSEATDRLDEMLHTGASYPMQESYGRDGAFSADQVYLVYEPADLERIIGYCQAAIEDQEAGAAGGKA